MNQISFPSQKTFFIVYNNDKTVIQHGSVDTKQQMTTPLANLEEFLQETDCQSRLLSEFNIFYSPSNVWYILYKSDKSEVVYNKLAGNTDLKKTLDVLDTFNDIKSWSDSLKKNFNIEVNLFKYL
jgi:hypothetical protein